MKKLIRNDSRMYDDHPGGPGVYGPITGAVKNGRVKANFMYNIKRTYCTSQRLPLIGSATDEMSVGTAYQLLLSGQAGLRAMTGLVPLQVATILPNDEFEVVLAMDGEKLLEQFGLMMKQFKEEVRADIEQRLPRPALRPSRRPSPPREVSSSPEPRAPAARTSVPQSKVRMFEGGGINSDLHDAIDRAYGKVYFIFRIL